MSNERLSAGGKTANRETDMPYETAQATSRDWLEGNETLSFSTIYFVEAATLSISRGGGNDIFEWGCLGDYVNLASELRLWDDLSDEALRKFEEEI
jgi:hypothetical protein